MYMFYYVGKDGNAGISGPFADKHFVHDYHPFEKSQCCWRIPNAPGDWSVED